MWYPSYISQTTSTSLYNMGFPQMVWVDEFRREPIVRHRTEHLVNGSGDWEPRVRVEIPREPRVDVEKRAKELLLSQLTEEQRKSLLLYGWFTVKSKRSGREYMIEAKSIVANVTRLDDRARLCAHLENSLPRHDHILAQKLMLEHDEDTFLRIANWH